MAIVASRSSTASGDRVAADLASQLAEAGDSSSSSGLGAAAISGALAVGGPVVVVLGSGVDQAYPRSHEGLLAEVLTRGTILSEQPSGAHPRADAPAAQPHPGQSREGISDGRGDPPLRGPQRTVLGGPVWQARHGRTGAGHQPPARCPRPSSSAVGPSASPTRPTCSPPSHPPRRRRHDPGHTDPCHRHGKSAGRRATSVGLHPADSLVALAIARLRVVLTALMDAADGQRPDAAQQFVSPLVAAGVEVTVLVTYGDKLGEPTGVLEHARGALADAMAVAGRPVEVLDTVEVARR